MPQRSSAEEFEVALLHLMRAVNSLRAALEAVRDEAGLAAPRQGQLPSNVSAKLLRDAEAHLQKAVDAVASERV